MHEAWTKFAESFVNIITKDVMRDCTITISPYSKENTNINIEIGDVSLFDIFVGLNQLKGLINGKIINMAIEETGIQNRAILQLYLEESLKIAEVVRTVLNT